MPPWKVIYVQSRAEKKIAERLLQKGIECYLPLKKELKQWSDRKKMVVSPLLNGYLFVRPTSKQRDEVLYEQGALQYLRYNGADAIVREIEIEALKSIEEKGYYAEGNFGAKLNKGDLVLIAHGPFKGLNGIVQSTNYEEHYQIAIESIDFCLSIKIPKEVIQKREGIIE